MRTSTFTAMVLADLLAGRSTTIAGAGNSAGQTVPGGVSTDGEVRPEPGPREPMTRRGRNVVKQYPTPAPAAKS